MVCDRDCFHCKYEDCILDEKADVNKQKAEWRRNNPEKVKTSLRKSYLRHTEKRKAYAKQYYYAHRQLKGRERVFDAKLYAKQYRETNAEKIRKYKKEYRERNREKIAKADKEYYLRVKKERIVKK